MYVYICTYICINIHKHYRNIFIEEAYCNIYVIYIFVCVCVCMAINTVKNVNSPDHTSALTTPKKGNIIYSNHNRSYLSFLISVLLIKDKLRTN